MHTMRHHTQLLDEYITTQISKYLYIYLSVCLGRYILNLAKGFSSLPARQTSTDPPRSTVFCWAVSSSINNCMGSREMRAASGLWTVNKVVNSAAARPRPRPHRTPRALHPLWVDTISSVLSIIHSTATTYLSCIYISMRTICGWWRVSTTQLLHLCSSHAHNANVRNLDMYQWVFSYSWMVAGMDAICMLIKHMTKC